MGSDNIFHKRKHQSIRALERKKKIREQYETVLIVCEGKKTEPYYFKAYRDDLKLNSAYVEVLGEGADPLYIVRKAISLCSDNDYDRIYCVFDKDEHPKYNEALSKITGLRSRVKKPLPIYAIPSVPCFEYWLLLHFVDNAKPYIRNGSKSAGDQLCSELKTHIRDYQKGQKDVFHKTKMKLTEAIKRAKRINAEQKKCGNDNPSTFVYELLEYLEQIKQKTKR